MTTNRGYPTREVCMGPDVREFRFQEEPAEEVEHCECGAVVEVKGRLCDDCTALPFCRFCFSEYPGYKLVPCYDAPCSSCGTGHFVYRLELDEMENG
jgi:hypothetical protein